LTRVRAEAVEEAVSSGSEDEAVHNFGPSTKGLASDKPPDDVAFVVDAPEDAITRSGDDPKVDGVCPRPRGLSRSVLERRRVDQLLPPGDGVDGEDVGVDALVGVDGVATTSAGAARGRHCDD